MATFETSTPVGLGSGGAESIAGDGTSAGCELWRPSACRLRISAMGFAVVLVVDTKEVELVVSLLGGATPVETSSGEWAGFVSPSPPTGL